MTILAHIELRKKLEDVYSKINNVGGSSILRKSNEERIQDFKSKTKKKEEEKKLLEEKQKRSGGFFATEIRV